MHLLKQMVCRTCKTLGHQVFEHEKGIVSMVPSTFRSNRACANISCCCYFAGNGHSHACNHSEPRELMLLFQIAASIVILNWVRNTIGPGTLSLAISAILIYIFVFLLPQFTVGLYVLYFLLVLGILDIVIWMSMLFPMKRIGQ